MFSFILSKGFGEHFKQLEFLYITGFSLQSGVGLSFAQRPFMHIKNHKPQSHMSAAFRKRLLNKTNVPLKILISCSTRYAKTGVVCDSNHTNPMRSHTDDVIILCRNQPNGCQTRFISEFLTFHRSQFSLSPPHINIIKFKGYDNFPSRGINEVQINKVAGEYSLLTHDHKSNRFLIGYSQ